MRTGTESACDVRVAIETNLVAYERRAGNFRWRDDGDSRLGPITWGAGQLGIAQGVLDAVAEGLLPAAEVPELILLVAVWVDPAAHDETAVKRANREAMRGAIADAVQPPSAEEILALAERREEAANIYYTGD